MRVAQPALVLGLFPPANLSPLLLFVPPIEEFIGEVGELPMKDIHVVAIDCSSNDEEGNIKYKEGPESFARQIRQQPEAEDIG